jgi:hypothetical protein
MTPSQEQRCQRKDCGLLRESSIHMIDSPNTEIQMGAHRFEGRRSEEEVKIMLKKIKEANTPDTPVPQVEPDIKGLYTVKPYHDKWCIFGPGLRQGNKGGEHVYSLEAEANTEAYDMNEVFAQGRLSLEGRVKELEASRKANQDTLTEATKRIVELEGEVEGMVEAIKKARGSLGYGPLQTKPETIAVVRGLLDEALAARKERI